ncbi:MAG: hypothetical protein AB7I19_14740 [Planctomycetota bacterium]
MSGLRRPVRRGLMFGWLGLATAAVHAQETVDPSIAFVELESSRSQLVIGERFELILRFGVDRARLEDLLQPVRRRLEVPVVLSCRWLREPRGVVASARPAGPGTLRTLLDAEIAQSHAEPDRERDGRRFAVFAVHRAYVAQAVGEFTVDGPELRAEFATGYRNDLLAGRIPTGKEPIAIQGASLELSIAALPIEGRPPEFRGAVGDFSLHAEFATSTATGPDVVTLLLDISGDGEWHGFDAPRIGSQLGVHELGAVEVPMSDRRRIAYDLRVGASPPRGPASIRLSTFVPGPVGGWREVATEAIEWPASFRGSVSPTNARPPLRDVTEFRIGSGDRSAVLAVVAVLGLAVLPTLVFVGWSSLRRARERRNADPLGRRARAAHSQFRATVDRDTTAVVEYLAARLRTSTAAVIAPDLADRLVAAGIVESLARSTAEFVFAGTAARYGAAAVDRENADDLVERLEAEFRHSEGSS